MILPTLQSQKRDAGKDSILLLLENARDETHAGERALISASSHTPHSYVRSMQTLLELLEWRIARWSTP